MAKHKRLTDAWIARYKGDWLGEVRKIYDEQRGLYLHVSPNGRKVWRYRYQKNGREFVLTLGTYQPDVPSEHTSLADARAAAATHAAKILRGAHPAADLRQTKDAKAERKTFKFAADDYLERSGPHRAETTVKRDKLMLKYCASVASTDVAAVKPTELQKILDGLTPENRRKARQFMRRVFDHAINQGWAEKNATPQSVFTEKVTTKARPAIVEPKAFGGLLRMIYGYNGHATVELALKVLPLVALRPGELRAATWSEIDLDNNVWTIPPARMKGNREHVVPISRQVRELLLAQNLYTDNGPKSLVFPSHSNREKPISENTLGAALRRLDIDTKTEHTPHGFRSSFSTLANEARQDSDLIEMSLAHAGGDKIKKVYDRSVLLEKRRELMQWWADYCDGLRTAETQ